MGCRYHLDMQQILTYQSGVLKMGQPENALYSVSYANFFVVAMRRRENVYVIFITNCHAAGDEVI